MMIELCQVRLCLTELEPSELAGHSKMFGQFAIEIPSEVVRKLGGMPVFYLPQALIGAPGLSTVGTAVMSALEEIRHLLEMMARLEYVATHTSEVDVIRARHLARSRVDDKDYVTNEFDLDLKQARKVLDYLGMEKQSYQVLANWAVFVQNMLYPTDDERHNKQLAYYRQREWRLISGLGNIVAPQDRELTGEERERLLRIDSRFWEKTLSQYLSAGTRQFQRVAHARIIETLDNRPISHYFTAVYVPEEVYDEALSLTGSKLPIQKAPL
ncbi:MAG TPA: hypothetical protein VH206_09630 [Xanthobacteraceae bacterium]|jgi:hypothetical protein|nr:hypothetical protein [Xanthobacteraceae bacterium]